MGIDLKFNENEIKNAKNIPQTINNYYSTTNIYNPKNVNSNISGNDNNFSYNEQSIDLDELKNSILKEISNEEYCKKALKMLEEIKKIQKENNNKQVTASALINLKDFLISIGASLSASLIQSKIGI